MSQVNTNIVEYLVNSVDSSSYHCIISQKKKEKNVASIH